MGWDHPAMRKGTTWGYFIKIEFLAWIDSSVCTESNSASIDHKWSYDHFYAVR